MPYFHDSLIVRVCDESFDSISALTIKQMIMQNKPIFLVNLITNVSENVIFAEALEIGCNKFDFYKLFCFRMRFILLLCFVGLALARPQVTFS